MDFLVDTTGTELTSLLRLGALYCDLEDTFGKAIDLITVSSIMQSSTEESDSDFTATVLKERVKLNAIAWLTAHQAEYGEISDEDLQELLDIKKP